MFKKSFLFSLFVILISGLAYYDYSQTESRLEKKKKAVSVLNKISFEAIQSISISSHQEKIELNNVSGSWSVLSPYTDKVDPGYISSLRSQLMEEISPLTLNAQEEEKYGFADKTIKVKLSTQEGRSIELEVSRQRTIDNKLYIKKINSGLYYLAPESWGDWVLKGSQGWRDLKVAQLGRYFDKMSFNKLVLERAQYWRLQGEEKPLDQAKVGGIINNLLNLKASKVVSEEKSAKQLRKYGLHKPSLKIMTKELPDKETEFLLSKKGGDYYLVVSSKAFIYKISKEKAKSFFFQRSEILKKEEEGKSGNKN